MTRYAESCKDVKFVDIDFPDLMEKKRRVIQETTELNSMLTNLNVSQDPMVFLQSDEYIQMGCDLRELDKIQQTLSRLIDIDDSEFIFVAEVSITYMETAAADAVIQWANSLGQGKPRASLLWNLQPRVLILLNSRVLSFGADPARWARTPLC